MGPVAWHRTAILGASLLWSPLACDPSSFGQPAPLSDAGTAPGASILPRPLATAPALVPGGDAGKQSRDAAVSRRDAAPPVPQPYGPRDKLSGERLDRRLSAGVRLVGHWEWRDVPKPAEAAALDEEAMAAAHEAARLRWEVQLSDLGRMRVTFDSLALPLPDATELRSRASRYGTLLLWPDRRTYRVIAPGALRTLLGEQRADVTPLTQGKVKLEGAGTKLDLDTRKLSVSSTLGRIDLELASLPEAGRGAPLLCRLLVELMAVKPSTAACVDNEVALAAELHWGLGDESRAGSRFVVDAVTRSIELRNSEFSMPPSRAALGRGLPGVPGGMFFDKDELGRWRKEEAKRDGPVDPNAPEAGLLARNRSERNLYLLLDGVPITLLRGLSERRIDGPKAGRYTLQWRSFLGDFIQPAEDLQIPARVGFEVPDAGAPAPDAG